MIKFENVSKTYNIGTDFQVPVLRNFNLSIKKGDFISIVGPNGSGKSTIFNLLCGETDIDDGKIYIKDREISKIKAFKRYRYVGRVHQNPAVGTCLNMTILENLAIADNKMKKYNLTWCINKDKINYYKEKLNSLELGLENKLDTKMYNLSGGQQQAISLLIATMNPVDVLLLDEHTAALDPKTGDIIMKLTNKLVREQNITTLMITHNLKNAINYGNRLLVIKQGKIVLDRSGKEKKYTKYDELIDKFNCI